MPSVAASAARRCGTSAGSVGRGTRGDPQPRHHDVDPHEVAHQHEPADPARRRRRLVAPDDARPTPVRTTATVATPAVCRSSWSPSNASAVKGRSHAAICSENSGEKTARAATAASEAPPTGSRASREARRQISASHADQPGEQDGLDRERGVADPDRIGLSIRHRRGRRSTAARRRRSRRASRARPRNDSTWNGRLGTAGQVPPRAEHQTHQRAGEESAPCSTEREDRHQHERPELGHHREPERDAAELLAPSVQQRERPRRQRDRDEVEPQVEERQQRQSEEQVGRRLPPSPAPRQRRRPRPCRRRTRPVAIRRAASGDVAAGRSPDRTASATACTPRGSSGRRSRARSRCGWPARRRRPPEPGSRPGQGSRRAPGRAGPRDRPRSRRRRMLEEAGRAPRECGPCRAQP